MSRYRTLFLTERGKRHQQAALEAAPGELDVIMLRQPSRDELWPHLAHSVFLISERAGAIDAGMIAAAPNLKLILRLGSLAHDIDLKAARAAGVAVCLRPQHSVIMVAEHVMMQMLALVKRLREVEVVALAATDWGQSRRTDEDTFAFNWSRRTDIGGLDGRTVGILGFGEIGAELARRLHGWGCRVEYNRRRRLPAATEADLAIHYVERDLLIAQSDFLVNLLPYSPQTELSLNAETFARMKRGAFLVSCGSGSVVNEADLADALRSGHLAGAALDTYEWEPIQPSNPLRLLAIEEPPTAPFGQGLRPMNVLLTPHTAGGAPWAGVGPTRADDYVPIMQFLRGEAIAHRLV